MKTIYIEITLGLVLFVLGISGFQYSSGKDTHLAYIVAMLSLISIVFLLMYPSLRLRIAVKQMINPYKSIPWGISFTKNGAEISKNISNHQAIVVKEWIENHPKIRINENIWLRASLNFNETVQTIAVTKDGIYLQDDLGNNVFTVVTLLVLKNQASLVTI